MNFVADESLDLPIILKLRENKHIVFSIAENHLASTMMQFCNLHIILKVFY